MEKKRSVGVTLFAISYLLSGALFLFGSPYAMLWTLGDPKAQLPSVICFALAGLSLLTSAFLLFKLKSLGWKLAPIGLIFTLPADRFRYIAIVLLTIHFYFFTRPKVKEQFR